MQLDYTSQTEDSPKATGKTDAGTGMILDDKMIDLYQSIRANSRTEIPPIFQFIGMNAASGAVALVRQLAITSARLIGKRVLLIDANRPTVHASPLNANPSSDLDAAYHNERNPDEVICDTSVAGLRLALLSKQSGTAPISLLSSDNFYNMLVSFAEDFDIILISPPPTDTSIDWLTIAPRVNGTILVVEAEKTRWQVADNLLQRIEGNGGTVTGVILNKRIAHIPQFIYRHL